MRCLPRLAVGSIQPGVRRDNAVGALLAALQWLGESAVLVKSSCSLSGPDLSRTILGRPSRHLDSWAMSRGDAISALARAAAEHETAIVEGSFDAGADGQTPNVTPPQRSSLDALCQWLDLPQVALIDVRLMSCCRRLAPPTKLEGILLSGVSSAQQAAYWQTTLESLWQAPVLGWLDDGYITSASHRAGAVSREDFERLGLQLAATLRIDKLRSLARKAPPLAPLPDPWLVAAGEHRFRVAVAYDQAY